MWFVDLLTAEAIKAISDGARPIPPPNMDAESPAEVRLIIFSRRLMIYLSLFRLTLDMYILFIRFVLLLSDLAVFRASTTAFPLLAINRTSRTNSSIFLFPISFTSLPPNLSPCPSQPSFVPSTIPALPFLFPAFRSTSMPAPPLLTPLYSALLHPINTFSLSLPPPSGLLPQRHHLPLLQIRPQALPGAARRLRRRPRPYQAPPLLPLRLGQQATQGAQLCQQAEQGETVCPSNLLLSLLYRETWFLSSNSVL
jgi:hypothetical protein